MILTAIIGILFYLTNEFEEASLKNEWKDKGNWLNSIKSWQNKWKRKNYKLVPYKKKWYHFGIAPAYEERFIYSSTVFVFITDGEHFFQLLKKLLIFTLIFYIDWKLGCIFIVGTLIGGLIKELFIKQIN